MKRLLTWLGLAPVSLELEYAERCRRLRELHGRNNHSGEPRIALGNPVADLGTTRKRTDPRLFRLNPDERA